MSDNVRTGIASVRSIIEARPISDAVSTALTYVEEAALRADETAENARLTLAATDPDDMVTHAENAFQKAKLAQAARTNADNAVDLTTIGSRVDASALSVFQRVISFDQTAENEAIEATTGIADAVEAIEAAQNYTTRSTDDPTKSIAEYSAVSAAQAVTTAQSAVATTKASANAAAERLLAARATLVEHLVDQAEASAKADAYVAARTTAQTALSDATADVTAAAADVATAQQNLATAQSATYNTAALKTASVALAQQQLTNARAELDFAKELEALFESVCLTSAPMGHNEVIA